MPPRRRSSGLYANINPLEAVQGAAKDSLWNHAATPGSKSSSAPRRGREAEASAKPKKRSRTPPPTTAADKPISDAEFRTLVGVLKSADDNAARITALMEDVNRRLFSSAQILELLDTTPSVKTKLDMVTQLLAPRCTNPSEGATALVAAFRFTEEKRAVQEALHSRERVLNSRKGPGLRGGSGTGGGSGGGSGGRGSGGRGSGGRGGGTVRKSLLLVRGGRGGRGGGTRGRNAMKKALTDTGIVRSPAQDLLPVEAQASLEGGKVEIGEKSPSCDISGEKTSRLDEGNVFAIADSIPPGLASAAVTSSASADVGISNEVHASKTSGWGILSSERATSVEAESNTDTTDRKDASLQESKPQEIVALKKKATSVEARSNIDTERGVSLLAVKKREEITSGNAVSTELPIEQSQEQNKEVLPAKHLSEDFTIPGDSSKDLTSLPDKTEAPAPPPLPPTPALTQSEKTSKPAEVISATPPTHAPLQPSESSASEAEVAVDAARTQASSAEQHAATAPPPSTSQTCGEASSPVRKSHSSPSPSAASLLFSSGSESAVLRISTATKEASAELRASRTAEATTGTAETRQSARTMTISSHNFMNSDEPTVQTFEVPVSHRRPSMRRQTMHITGKSTGTTAPLRAATLRSTESTSSLDGVVSGSSGSGAAANRGGNGLVGDLKELRSKSRKASQAMEQQWTKSRQRPTAFVPPLSHRRPTLGVAVEESLQKSAGHGNASDEGLMHRGWLHRKDKGLVMGGSPWKSIFAVLQRESAQGSYFLFFYKAWFTQVARGTQRPIGKVLLNGGHLADTKSDRGFYNFLFVTATGKSHAIRLTTRHERDLWVQKISDVLRRSS